MTEQGGAGGDKPPAPYSGVAVMRPEGADYHPNQLALDVVREVEEGDIVAMAVVCVDAEGRLRVSWTDTDTAELCRMAMYLHAAAQEELRQDDDEEA